MKMKRLKPEPPSRAGPCTITKTGAQRAPRHYSNRKVWWTLWEERARKVIIDWWIPVYHITREGVILQDIQKLQEGQKRRRQAEDTNSGGNLARNARTKEAAMTFRRQFPPLSSPRNYLTSHPRPWSLRSSLARCALYYTALSITTIDSRTSSECRQVKSPPCPSKRT